MRNVYRTTIDYIFAVQVFWVYRRIPLVRLTFLSITSAQHLFHFFFHFSLFLGFFKPVIFSLYTIVISFNLSVSIELYYKRNAVYCLPPRKQDHSLSRRRLCLQIASIIHTLYLHSLFLHLLCSTIFI